MAGPQSRFVSVEAEACADYLARRQTKNILLEEQPPKWTSQAGQLERRIKTIVDEHTLTFLSRKSVIPKYGFPVDVVNSIRIQRTDRNVVSRSNRIYLKPLPNMRPEERSPRTSPNGRPAASKQSWGKHGRFDITNMTTHEISNNGTKATRRHPPG